MEEIFKAAKQIFIKGMEQQANTYACFSKTFEVNDIQEDLILLISAHVSYRAYINGTFISHGPAPAPFGYLRADRIKINGQVKLGRNRLSVEVMGYAPRENNYATFESSCLCAEIYQGSEIVIYTDKLWECNIFEQKYLKTETLSFGRRVPLEWYRLDHGYGRWRADGISGGLVCEELDRPCTFLERGVSLPEFKIDDSPVFSMAVSMMKGTGEGPAVDWWESETYYGSVGAKDLCRPSAECSSLKNTAFDGTIFIEDNFDKQGAVVLSDYTVPAGLEFAFEEAETGFIGMIFESKEPVQVDILFNDYLTEDGGVPAKADSVNRVIRLQTKGGKYAFEGFEAHFLKHVKLIVTGGNTFTVKKLYLRSYRHPDQYRANFRCDDDLLNRIYQSGRQTLLTNSLGFFLDSPERERAGWAGDSYWTGRAAQVLLSDVKIERAMLEDFLLAEPTKMMPFSFPSCCCGGDRQEEVMMPTWNMFVLLELTDYYRRTKDDELREKYKARVYGWMNAITDYENEMGLLEDLPGSLFLDWSASNQEDYNRPISTAINAFYAFLLKRTGELYEEVRFLEKAERVYKTLREKYESIKAARHEVFTMYPYIADSLYTENNQLKEKKFYSEAAQYYYFWSGMLDEKRAPELAKNILSQLGPAPSEFRGTAHLSLGNAGIFFGYMLRFEVLSMLGEFQQLKKDLKYLGNYMVSRDPHTFWETLGGTDSRNHGFGAHLAVVCVRDFLGIEIPDRVEKKVKIAPHPCGLKWAKGGYKTVDGPVQVQWYQNKTEFRLIATIPQDYQAEITLPKELMYAEKVRVNEILQDMEQIVTVKGNVSICIPL